jgi:hypothetical protein
MPPTFFGNRANDDGTAARMLIETMQVQAKIYEEWMEVMGDYSTVFSDDCRGVTENYYDQGNDRKENNATVRDAAREESYSMPF